ncbi:MULTISPECIES: hypothetical protein [Vibrio]|uniref:hypothetical protein n=1 Tax=Vibrio TaxID=662 RepID=UPI000C84E841|nr:MULTISPECIES: hypothetical protein [Vibrio]PMJ63846.1 hypothetical protein BCU18_17775 [Vibrio lentus]
MQVKKSGLELLESALERLLSGNVVVLPSNARLNIKNVEIEAGMGDGSAYHYPDLIERIKEAKARVAPKRKEVKSPTKSALTTATKNVRLTKSNAELKFEKAALLVAQTELTYNLFQCCDDPKFIVDAYEHSNNVLPFNKPN